MDMNAACYLHNILNIDMLQQIVSQVCRITKGIEYDTILVRGVSGIAVGFPVALVVKKPIGVVRKGEYSHSRYTLEGPVRIGKYIVIDDLIETGATVQYICAEARKRDCTSTCVAVITYRQNPEWHDRITHLRYVTCNDNVKHYGF